MSNGWQIERDAQGQARSMSWASAAVAPGYVRTPPVVRAKAGAVSLPLFDTPDPAYFRGSTARTRRTSASGAVAALTDRTRKIDTLRRLWTRPLTIQAMSAISGYPIASVCSLKKCLSAELVEVGEETKYWPDGRVTRRTQWQIEAGR